MAVSLAVVVAILMRPGPPLHIRIIGASRDDFPPGYFGWVVGVTKIPERDGRWWVTFQETNRSAVAAVSIAPLLNRTANLPWSVWYETADENVVTGSMLWNTGKVYRAIGYYSDRSKFHDVMAGAAARHRTILRVFQKLPQPKYRGVTSEWVEVKAP